MFTSIKNGLRAYFSALTAGATDHPEDYPGPRDYLSDLTGGAIDHPEDYPGPCDYLSSLTGGLTPRDFE